MYLENLELQGFKTFAQKTLFEFPPPAGGRRGVTGIVGPNGSGKSNSADAMRWVLGEQSLKLLRGKKSEDVIFSGTDRRARSGFAEVSLTLNNEDHSAPIDFTTLVLTRRLYRDGQSEYLVNGKPARLGDIQLLLAQANIGQRTYSVIGQGMVDHVLVASPQERKEFFDEAAGVRQFQIKRNQAMNKLAATHDNLAQADGLLHEIEPRLRSLSRQVRRLEERGPLETELHALGRAYYGKLWKELDAAITKKRAAAQEIEGRRTKKAAELTTLRRELETMEASEAKATGFLELQKEYEALSENRNRVREELLKLQNTIALAKMQSTKAGAVPLPKIIGGLETVVGKQQELLNRLDTIRDIKDLEPIRMEFRTLAETSATLLRELTSGSERSEPDPKLIAEEKNLQIEITAFDTQLEKLQARIKNYAGEEREKKGRFFAVQREWEARQSELAAIDREANDLKVELARVETQRDGLAHEIELEMQKKPTEFLAGDLPPLSVSNEEASERIRRIKTQLELIGSIDPEVMREHEETKTRHDFLSTQIEDLKKATADLESGIADLDRVIEERTEIAFKTINEEFGKYFKRLFDGGHALLEKVMTVAEEEGETATEDESDKEVGSVDGKKKKEYTGIDIHATPPGKRVKSINMLSGGERALTSIALICAIMASNPSPFVVLDEVDAALDESNSIRFADIVHELSVRTQFIVITHNRATMHIANVLYGVTMGDDGSSRVLSLKLEEAEAIRDESKVAV